MPLLLILNSAVRTSKTDMGANLSFCVDPYTHTEQDTPPDSSNDDSLTNQCRARAEEREDVLGE